MTPLIPGSDQIHIHPVIFFLPIPYTRHPIVYLLITLLMNFFVNRVDWTEAFSICHICHRLWSRMIPLNHLQTAPCHRSEAKTPLLSRVMIVATIKSMQMYPDPPSDIIVPTATSSSHTRERLSATRTPCTQRSWTAKPGSTVTILDASMRPVGPRMDGLARTTWTDTIEHTNSNWNERKTLGGEGNLQHLGWRI